MAGRSLGALTIDLILRAGGFTQGMDRASRLADQRTKEMQRSFQNLQRSVNRFLGIFGGAVTVGAFAAFTKRTIDSADQMLKLTQRIGGTTEELSELQHVANLSGVQFNTLTMGLQRMTRRIAEAAQGTGEARAALRELGLDAVALSRLSLGQQFEAIAAMISQVGNESDRTRLAMKLFDSEGVALLQTMTRGAEGIRAMRREASDLGLTIDKETAEAAANANDALTRMRASVDGLARNALPTLAKALEVVATGWNRLLFGADPFPFEKQIVSLEEKVKSLQALLENTNPDMEIAAQWREELEAAEAELEKFMSRQREALGLGAEGAAIKVDVPELPTIPAGPSEEFEKIASQLRQQIELHGQVGEAAKVAYQIRTDALKDLSAAEQQEILHLAERLDALNASAEVARQFEQAQQELARTRNAEIENQIALTRELTEFERLHLQLKRGEFDGFSSDQFRALEALAEEIDLMREKAALEREVRDVTESVLTPLEQYQRSIENLNRLREESIALLGENALSEETYNRLVQQAQDTFEEMSRKARTTADDIGEALGRGMHDAVVGWMMGVETNFADMLKRMALQAATSQLFDFLSTLGGPAGKAFSFLGFGGARASGGPVFPGRAHLVGERGPEYFVSSTAGRIVPAGGGTNVIVNNAPAGTEVETRQTGPGIEEIIINIGGQALASGRWDPIMRGRFGVPPTTGMR